MVKKSRHLYITQTKKNSLDEGKQLCRDQNIQFKLICAICVQYPMKMMDMLIF